jgi:hypothetical protein
VALRNLSQGALVPDDGGVGESSEHVFVLALEVSEAFQHANSGYV